MRFAVSLQLSAPKRIISEFLTQSYALEHKKHVTLGQEWVAILAIPIFILFPVDTVSRSWAKFPLDFFVWEGYIVVERMFVRLSMSRMILL